MNIKHRSVLHQRRSMQTENTVAHDLLLGAHNLKILAVIWVISFMYLKKISRYLQKICF